MKAHNNNYLKNCFDSFENDPKNKVVIDDREFYMLLNGESYIYLEEHSSLDQYPESPIPEEKPTYEDHKKQNCQQQHDNIANTPHSLTIQPFNFTKDKENFHPNLASSTFATQQAGTKKAGILTQQQPQRKPLADRMNKRVLEKQNAHQHL